MARFLGPLDGNPHQLSRDRIRALHRCYQVSQASAARLARPIGSREQGRRHLDFAQQVRYAKPSGSIDKGCCVANGRSGCRSPRLGSLPLIGTYLDCFVESGRRLGALWACVWFGSLARPADGTVLVNAVILSLKPISSHPANCLPRTNSYVHMYG